MKPMKWQASHTMFVAIVAMSVLRSAGAQHRTLSGQTLGLSNRYNLLGNLSGAIPDAVGSWSKMTALKVEYQKLRGPIPDAIGSMIGVRTFRASANRLGGSIPDVLVPWLQCFFLLCTPTAYQVPV